MRNCLIFYSFTGINLYFFSVYYYVLSENILELEKKFRDDPSKLNQAPKKEKSLCEPSCNDAWIEALYTRARKRAKILFWSFQIALILSVVSFIISSGVYFFGDKANAESQKNCTNLISNASVVLPQGISEK